MDLYCAATDGKIRARGFQFLLKRISTKHIKLPTSKPKLELFIIIMIIIAVWICAIK